MRMMGKFMSQQIFWHITMILKAVSYTHLDGYKRQALHNFGCKVNAYETEAMQQILENAGYEIVPFTEYADVYRCV